MMRVALALFAMLTVAAAKPADWTRSVTRAPNGAFVLGNPNAKVRLVEYLSYSCPHCAHFTAEASAPIRKSYIAAGSTAVEIRNAVRDRYDFAAAMLARCGGPTRFFGNSEALFAAQDSLLAKAESFEATNAVAENAPVNDSLKAMARGAGLTDFMVARGFTPAQLDACLTDKATQAVVLAMTKEAWETRKIPGTPAFLINGKQTGGGWAQIEPQLRAAASRR